MSAAAVFFFMGVVPTILEQASTSVILSYERTLVLGSSGFGAPVYTWEMRDGTLLVSDMGKEEADRDEKRVKIITLTGESKARTAPRTHPAPTHPNPLLSTPLHSTPLHSTPRHCIVAIHPPPGSVGRRTPLPDRSSSACRTHICRPTVEKWHCKAQAGH